MVIGSNFMHFKNVISAHRDRLSESDTDTLILFSYLCLILESLRHRSSCKSSCPVHLSLLQV